MNGRKHGTGWQSDTARRLLAERGEPVENEPEKVVDASRKTFFDILHQPDDANARGCEGDPAGAQQRSPLLPDDEWMAKAGLRPVRGARDVLQRLIAEGSFVKATCATPQTLRRSPARVRLPGRR